MREQIVRIPYEPRALQQEFHERKERFAVLVCHRRWGKTVACVNDLVRAAVTSDKERPRFAYVGPTYRQTKLIVWDYLRHFASPIPGSKFNEAELRCDLEANGARISLFGSDNPDALRGAYFDGVVLDEYAQQSPRVWGEILRPALADRLGWAVFIGTPQGRNHFSELWDRASGDPAWHARMYRASETGILPQEELDAARKEMSAEQYAQEFECSWSAALMGAYYAALLDTAEAEGRIGKVPVDPHALVDTAWDLGIGDATSIWFTQRVGKEVRWVDYYEASGEPLSHYVRVVKERGYTYGQHHFPHDAAARELISGQSREQALRSLGLTPVIQAQHKVEDGIEAVRRLLPQSWFDRERCAAGLEALRQYRKEYNDRLQAYALHPLHDWTSHAADAARCYAMARPPKPKWEPIDYDSRWVV